MTEQREKDAAEKERYDWTREIVYQGAWSPEKHPWSLDGAPSLPMPVQIAEHCTLEPFFEHLALDGNHNITSGLGVKAVVKEEPHYNVESLEFERGVVSHVFQVTNFIKSAWCLPGCSSIYRIVASIHPVA